MLNRRPRSLAEIGREIATRLPPTLQADLARYGRTHDAAIRNAMEAVGAPHMDSGIAHSMLAHSMFQRPPFQAARPNGGFGAPAPSPARPYGSPNMPVVSDPFIGAGMGAAGGGDGLDAGGENVRRHPFVIWGATSLAASAQGTNASPTAFQNPSNYPFVMTHITFSEGQTNFDLAPSFQVLIKPVGQSQWMTQAVDAGALLTRSMTTPIPNSAGYQGVTWRFAAPYLQGRSGSFIVIGRNPGGEAVYLSLGLIGYKRNSLGTPRVWWDASSIAASSTSDTILNSQLFKGDGDFDALITDLVVSAAGNRWGVNTQAPPQVYVRPDNSDLAFMPIPVPAVAFNNTPGGLGAYWELATPQRMLPTQNFAMSFNETTGAAVIANVGLVGYLEIPV